MGPAAGCSPWPRSRARGPSCPICRVATPDSRLLGPVLEGEWPRCLPVTLKLAIASHGPGGHTGRAAHPGSQPQVGPRPPWGLRVTGLCGGGCKAGTSQCTVRGGPSGAPCPPPPPPHGTLASAWSQGSSAAVGAGVLWGGRPVCTRAPAVPSTCHREAHEPSPRRAAGSSWPQAGPGQRALSAACFTLSGQLTLWEHRSPLPCGPPGPTWTWSSWSRSLRVSHGTPPGSEQGQPGGPLGLREEGKAVAVAACTPDPDGGAWSGSHAPLLQVAKPPLRLAES